MLILPGVSDVDTMRCQHTTPAQAADADPNHQMVGGSWAQTGPGSHTDAGYSGVFSCQPVSWFPPPQVLQYANMLAACDGCCSVWTAGEECDAAAGDGS